MIAIDGNNSLKRVRQVGNHTIADQRVFEDSDYFISREYVNQFADEVKAQKSTRNSDGDVAEPATEQGTEQGGIVAEVAAELPSDGGDPTDGAEGAVVPCADNWKAAAADDAKRMWALFDETGVFAAACRHGFILWVADMVRSGELYVRFFFFISLVNFLSVSHVNFFYFTPNDK
jgi:Kyakuja-Dileera-Zisupton transposase